MSKNQLIVLGVAVAIIIVLGLIGVVVQMGRRRKIEANRAKANELREEGNRTQLRADEEAANAASTDARARQARVMAEKLEQEATARAKDAQGSRDRAQEHHRRAMELDPDNDNDGDGALEDQRQQRSIPVNDQR